MTMTSRAERSHRASVMPDTSATRRVTRARRSTVDLPVDGNLALRPRPIPDRAPTLRVTPPAPVPVPRAPFVLLVLTLVVGGVLGILLLHTKIAENAFRLDDLHKRQAVLDQRQEQLERELAEKASAGSLEAEARKLGLVGAGDPAYVRMPDGQVFGVPRRATGAPSVTSQSGGR